MIKPDIKHLPDTCGVYLMKSYDNRIIYIGKAKSIVKRVRSYFNKDLNASFKQKALLEKIHSIDYVLTDSENESLILENELIKKYQPFFNVRQKDDKTFSYIVITDEKYPAIAVRRMKNNDKFKYHTNPYTNSQNARTIINFARKYFKIRNCKLKIGEKSSLKPCLSYQIDLCNAPCAGKISAEEYNKSVLNLILFLKGKYEIVIKELKDQLKKSANDLLYEKCIKLRDLISALQSLRDKQKIVLRIKENSDFIGISSNSEKVSIFSFIVRDSRVVQEKKITFDNYFFDKNELFLKYIEFISDDTDLPDNVYLNSEKVFISAYEDIISKNLNKKIKIIKPLRGEKFQLLELAEKNADNNLKKELINKYDDHFDMKTLSERLRLKKIPVIISAIDISNISGTNAVGSYVVFKNGLPDKKNYRLFTIKNVNGINDYLMIQEVITRLIKNAFFGNNPDILLIDGGIGHLNCANEILNDKNIFLFSLSKENETLFFADGSDPVNIKPDDKALRIFLNIRDEAHRFAVKAHSRKRSISYEHSVLDKIKGIGIRKKRILLNIFGSVENIKSVNIKELLKIKGLTLKDAENIINYFKKNINS